MNLGHCQAGGYKKDENRCPKNIAYLVSVAKGYGIKDKRKLIKISPDIELEDWFC